MDSTDNKTIESLKLLDDFVGAGVITKEAAEEIASEREAMIESAASDALHGEEKTASLVELMQQIKGRVSPNPALRSVDPTYLHSLQEAYKEGIRQGAKKVPASAMSMGSPWRTAAALMALAIGARGAGAAVESFTDRARRKKLRQEVVLSRETMFDKNPELKENRELANEAFDVLERYAPSMAASPTVAGTFVRQTLNQGGYESVPVEPVQVKSLIESELSREKAHDIGAPGSGELSKGVSRDVSSVVGKMMAGELF